jgi:ribosomal protein S18 acetylase RimI-like enzyme
VVDVRIQVVGVGSYTVEGLLSALLRLYRECAFPPHFYLVHDLLYEPGSTEVIVKLTQEAEVESYVLVWRHERGCSVHVWGGSSLELLRYASLDTAKPHIVELYSPEEEVVEKASSCMRSRGFRATEVKWFHDMTCTEDSFKPSSNEHLAVKLSPSHAEAFAEYAKRGDEETTLEEAKAKLAKRTYYGVFVDSRLASAGAVCARMPELGLICDVYTREEYRRRGYATAVTSAATRRVVSSGATAFLCVEEGNEEAMRIYRKLGYSLLRTRPWVIAKP